MEASRSVESELEQPPAHSHDADAVRGDSRSRESSRDPEPTDLADAADETSVSLLRLFAAFAGLFVVLSLAGWAFRTPLSSFGGGFVERFGLYGIVLGSFLADSFHFPIPPQFYLWTGIVGGQSRAVVVAAVLVGSELGGLAAFSLARMAGRSHFFDARIARARRLVKGYFERLGYRGLALVALLPVSYCLLSMAAGATRLPYRAYAVLAAMRVPRILFSYVVIVLAWTVG